MSVCGQLGFVDSEKCQFVDGEKCQFVDSEK